MFFQNMNVKKLKDLKEVLDSLKQVDGIFKALGKCRGKMTSERMKNLTGHAGNGNGIVPEFIEKIQEFEKIIDWTELKKDSEHVPEPNMGVDEEYDGACKKIKEIERFMEEELARWQELFSDSSISFVHKKYVCSVLVTRFIAI